MIKTVLVPLDGSPLADQLSQHTYDDPAWGAGPLV